MAPPSTRAAEEGDAASAFDCAICFLPLKAPPIFQCNAGHVICLSCGGKLPVGRCRVCRTTRAGGYRRGHVRDLGKRPAYLRPWLPRERHTYLRRARCPADACRFAGSATALLAHFHAAHRWPCFTGVSSGESFDLHLQDGVNVVAVDREDDDDRDADTDESSLSLLVLRVRRETLCRNVYAFCIHPSAVDELPLSSWMPSPPSSKPVQCQVSLTYSRYALSRCGRIRSCFQRTKADVACTDLADGLPDTEDCFQATVPNDEKQDEDEDTVEVRLCVTIAPRFVVSI